MLLLMRIMFFPAYISISAMRAAMQRRTARECHDARARRTSAMPRGAQQHAGRMVSARVRRRLACAAALLIFRLAAVFMPPFALMPAEF